MYVPAGVFAGTVTSPVNGFNVGTTVLPLMPVAGVVTAIFTSPINAGALFKVSVPLVLFNNTFPAG